MFGWLYKRIARGVIREIATSEVIEDKFWEIAQSEEMGKYLTDLQENITNMAVHKISSSIGGYNSAISRSLKGMEKDLMKEGIKQALPPELQGFSNLVAKYADKYPFLAQFVASGAISGNQAQSSPQTLNPQGTTPNMKRI